MTEISFTEGVLFLVITEVVVIGIQYNIIDGPLTDHPYAPPSSRRSATLWIPPDSLWIRCVGHSRIQCRGNLSLDWSWINWDISRGNKVAQVENDTTAKTVWNKGLFTLCASIPTTAPSPYYGAGGGFHSWVNGLSSYLVLPYERNGPA